MRLSIPPGLARLARGSERPDYAVEGGEGDLWMLSLWGPLPLGWAGNLAHNCAGAHMSVVDGEGTRLTTGRWASVFTLLPDACSVEARQFDFAAMALRRPRPPTRLRDVRLAKLTVEHDRRAMECHVTLEAQDRLGLLAFLLSRFAGHYLYPVRLSLRTANGRVANRFALTGAGGAPLGMRAVDALEEDLGRFVEPAP